jgi:hypothetical protein
MEGSASDRQTRAAKQRQLNIGGVSAGGGGRRECRVGVFLAACFGGTILHMSDQRLGRLERVELRDIWTNETNALRVALRD